MEFSELKTLLQNQVSKILKNHDTLFVTDVDKEALWDTYLNSFPLGTNEVYRERREFDCSCCRHFIKSFGNVVVINNNTITTIWDFNTNDDTYQPVLSALSDLVKSSNIKDVFITKQNTFGTDKSREILVDKSIHIWNHFQIVLPKKFITKSLKSEASLMGAIRDVRNVFKRSLDEISKEAIETVLELIAQKSLYKGDEWNAVLKQFLVLHNEYNKLEENEKELYCWNKIIEVGSVIGKIKNHSIGVLLIDISNSVDLNSAVRKYEVIIAPTNYKRPKAIFTKKMIEQAQQTIIDMGLLSSLERRHATLEDITINNILFSNKDSAKVIGGDIFSELSEEVTVSTKKFSKIEEVSIDRFIEQILPTTTNIEVLFENKHLPNLVSLISPTIKDSKNLLKWNNNFSWAYSGNITDSIKENVKAAGGNISGVLRFSIQWNEDGDNKNDFDAHCVEPNKNHIYYSNAKRIHPSSGMLDVDIIDPGSKIAVENIVWTSIEKMPEGKYKFYVYNYSHRGGRSGFRAEIEYDGQIYSYEYNKDIKHKGKVTVAEIQFDRSEGIKFIKSLPSSVSSRTAWSIQTNQFHTVSVCMFSPNYWDEQKGIGHKHYMFILNNCKNEENPNGFFNEFLKEELMEHKRIFEALGSKMKVEQSDQQLSGLGFSSTKRNELICKIDGSFKRTIKLIF